VTCVTFLDKKRYRKVSPSTRGFIRWVPVEAIRTRPAAASPGVSTNWPSTAVDVDEAPPLD